MMAELNTAAVHRSLDFVILGTARSGTTALGSAVNLDPECFCGVEYFRGEWHMDYSKLSLPDDFLSDRFKASNPRNTAETHKILREKLAAGPVKFYGNKNPSYFFIISKLHHDLPGLRSAALYRNPSDLAASWDRRATNPKDPWNAGRTGLMGLLNWIVEVARYGEGVANLNVVDYASMFLRDASIFPVLMRHISGRDTSPEAIVAFERTIFQAAPEKPRRARQVPGAPKPHVEFLSHIGVPDLDAAMREAAFAPSLSLVPVLRPFAEANFDKVFGYVLEAVRIRADVEEIGYALRWARLMLTMYDDTGSWTFKAMKPMFARFGEQLGPLADENGQGLAKRIRNLARKDLPRPWE